MAATGGSSAGPVAVEEAEPPAEARGPFEAFDAVACRPALPSSSASASQSSTSSAGSASSSSHWPAPVAVF